MLLYIYLASFIVGAILLGASLLLGHHGVESHLPDDLANGMNGHMPMTLSDGGHGAAGSSPTLEGHDFWLPFISVRFWVFFLCFFGLTGLAFTTMSLAGKWITLLLAIGMGVLVGFCAAYLIQRLKKVEVGTVINEEDFRGQEGVVLLPCEPGAKGKIRLELRGQTVDLLALNDDVKAIDIGEKVMIIDFKENQAIIVRSPELMS